MYCGLDLIGFVWHRLEGNFVDEELMMTVVGNAEHGRAILDLLWQWTGDLPITSEIAKFYDAAKAGIKSEVQNPLEAGVNPDLPNIHGATPLRQAAARGHVTVVEILLTTGMVDVNSPNTERQNPIFFPAEHGIAVVTNLLLKHGANLHVPDVKGNTPIVIIGEKT
ncbi:ankyrin repeat protein [Penicillium cataractarum]|uniref:Ankyrin repeat protein n=1 Tax=Penicillium cataractarum TaxID=2100454 RepID=A0A9W9R8B0_9EURO|nr:ankyrin repeat protein [Penicillium cataractarum]KAJ5355550.1 ankyrin repeat protein [Penicillium cataractarum]